jgi:hypothetical protein
MVISLAPLACANNKKNVAAKHPGTDTAVQKEHIQKTKAALERQREYDSATAQTQNIADVDSNSAPEPTPEQDAQELAAIIERHNGDLGEGDACAEAGFNEERCKTANLILARQLANQDSTYRKNRNK